MRYRGRELVQNSLLDVLVFHKAETCWWRGDNPNIKQQLSAERRSRELLRSSCIDIKKLGPVDYYWPIGTNYTRRI